MTAGQLPKTVARLACWVLFALLLLVAVLVGGARLILSQPELLTEWAERVVAGTTGEPVAFDAVEARLDGLSPRVTLTGVRLAEGARELRFESLSLDLDAWRSLWQARPVLESVRLAGAHLQVTRYPNGRVRVQSRKDNVLEVIPVPDEIRFTDLSIDWRADGPQSDPVRLRDVQLRAVSSSSSTRLAGQARLPGDGGEIRFRADVTSGMRGKRPLEARVQVAGQGVDAARLGAAVGDRLAGELGTGGRLDGDLWLTWEASRLQRVTAAGQWRRPRLAGIKGPDTMAGAISWRRRDGGWRVDARGSETGDTVPRVSLALRHEKAGWRLGIRGLRLDPWVDELMGHDRLPARARRLLSPVDAEGRVRVLQLARRSEDWRLEAKMADGAISPSGAYPGIDNVDLALRCDPDGGQAEVSVSDSTLRAPRHFERPLAVARGEAALSWRRRQGGGMAWHLDRARFGGPKLAGRAHGRLHHSQSQEPSIDGELRLHRADGAALLGQLKPSARQAMSLDWLATRLTNGKLTQAIVTASGPVSALRFQGQGNGLRLRSGFRAARLDYAQGWPALAKAGGYFELGRDGLTVRFQRGRVGPVALDGGEVRLPDLGAPSLRINAQARSDFARWRELFQGIPIGRPEAVDRFRLRGEASLELALDFPLDGNGLASIGGTVRLHNAGVTDRVSDYRLRRLDGAVSFDRDGLSWEGVEARLNGRRVTSRGWTEGSGSEARIRTVARTRASLTELLPGSSRADSPLKGRAEWLFDADLPGWRATADDWRLELSSDLSGLAVAIPAPFGKTRDESRRLSLVAAGDGGKLEPITLAYGRNVRAIAAIRGGRMTRGTVRLGGGAAELPEAEGLRINGRVEQLDLGRMRQYAALMDGRSPGTGTGAFPPLSGAVLEVGSLRAGGYAVRSLDVGLARVDEGWRVRLGGPNAKGKLTAAAGEAGIELAMERLSLERLRDPGALDVSDPTDFPPLQVSIDDLRLDGSELGQLRLRVRRVGDGIELSELTLDNAAMLLRMSGAWQGGQDQSRIEATMETVDAGAVLDRFGAGREIEGGRGRLSADLSWAGSLLDPDRASLTGRIDLDLRNGSLPTVEPGAGRVFGLLSLSLLPRRLMLDFAPITNEGLPFDRIRAGFEVANGVAQSDPLYLSGPMARIDVVGTVDLVDRRYDQRITVLPRISPSLPLLGGLAGGAPAALLLLLGQDLVAEGMAPFTQVQYQLEGPWSAPQLERVGDGLLER